MKKLTTLNLFALMLLNLFTTTTYASTVETVSQWNGAQYIRPFGENNTATYGQTFTVGSDNYLDSFTFFINDFVNPDFVDFRAYISAWDGSKSVGQTLFSSSDLHTSNNNGANGFEEFEILTSGLSLLSGAEYVAYFSTSYLFDGIRGTSIVGATDNTYADGNFVYMNNRDNFSKLNSINWNQRKRSDLAFTMKFSDELQGGAQSVPAPTSIVLIGLGLMGLSFSRKNNNKVTV